MSRCSGLDMNKSSRNDPQASESSRAGGSGRNRRRETRPGNGSSRPVLFVGGRPDLLVPSLLFVVSRQAVQHEAAHQTVGELLRSALKQGCNGSMLIYRLPRNSGAID
jgi:hypothetical protein